MKFASDPRGRITTYQYDGFGQLWSMNSPDTGITTQVWDAGGLRTSMNRADGVTVTYGHDDLGRPTTRSAGGQTHTTVWDSCTFGVGRICQINDPHQSLSLTYTKYGDLASQTPTIGGAGYAHNYQYDLLGRLIGIQEPGNVSVNYGWTLDRVTTVSATINGLTVPIVSNVIHTQNQNGTFRDIRFPNARSRQEYTDLDGRLFGIVADTTKGFGYSFDTNNRLTGLVNYANGDWSQTYGYDNLDRLTSATSPTLGNQSFQYDGNGNRTSHTVNGATTVHSISATSNRLNSLSGVYSCHAGHRFLLMPVGCSCACRSVGEWV